MSEFGKAFAAARKSGKKTFDFKGKSYTTKVKKETAPKARPNKSSTRPKARPGGKASVRPKARPTAAEKPAKASTQSAARATPTKATKAPAEAATKSPVKTVKGKSSNPRRPQTRSKSNATKSAANKSRGGSKFLSRLRNKR